MVKSIERQVREIEREGAEIADEDNILKSSLTCICPKPRWPSSKIRAWLLEVGKGWVGELKRQIVLVMQSEEDPVLLFHLCYTKNLEYFLSFLFVVSAIYNSNIILW